MKPIRRPFFGPTRILALGFAVVILLGGLLLRLPVSIRVPGSIRLLDALFTATSAVCVTGLVVVETGAAYTGFGQAVILVLIQIGGLGFMTMATLVLMMLGRRITLRSRMVIQESMNVSEFTGLLQLVQFVLWMSLGIELVGAALLALRFVPRFGWSTGLWYSVFHAVSAYCNAGFDIFGQGDSLAPYAGDPLVILTISALIVLGGLGFVVLRDIMRNGLHPRRWRLHTKAVVSATVTLLFLGTALFLLMEIDNPETLGDPALRPGGILLRALMQSVTVRTAGFFSISQHALHEVSKLQSVLLMFVGASPASTGGGVKTTTMLVLLSLCVSVARGREDATLFRRRLTRQVAQRAVTIFMIALVMVLGMTVLLAVVESALGPEGPTLLDLLFEATSALATVGLTTGVTPGLSVPGKLFIMFLMYMGRVGPLTLTLALAGRQQAGGEQGIRLPHGNIMVG